MFNNRFYGTKTQSSLDNDALRRLAPSVFAETKHESRKETYKFIPTINIIEALRNEGFLPVYAAESRVRDETKKGFAKHLLRFRQHDGFSIVGDVKPEIVLLNSHDGTSSYQLSAGLYRLVCSNGMIVADGQIDCVRVRHSGNVIDNVIEGTYKIITETPRAIEHMDAMRGLNLTRDEQGIFAEVAKGLRWDADETNVKNDELLRPRRDADRSPDLWTTFNVLQEKLLKGGVEVQNKKTKRSQRAQEVKGVGENVRLNKAIWTLAEEMRKLKAA
ncbi:DUF932 domain-containing protein [Methylomonas sp. MO1]|uniref:DUF932 domain-containing protein n=1 Tax=Methylomonas sp. MO1 TaxID=3073619 RepID=UPI0028A46CE8|nr:DUF932 domain-containing protein [Methylomonas sp. MO1]MDT4292386.1 DUF932 domain-containing protein [Methylomonas sp. MO1]